MPSRMLRRRRGVSPPGVLASLVSAGLMGGCAPAPSATLFVGAASSMQSTLEARGRAFEDSHPGVRVEIIGDSSSRLARQLIDGAPYDVFVSARVDLGEELHRSAITSEPVIITATGLALAYPQARRGDDQPRLPSLVAGATTIAVADPSVPLGQYTHRWLSASGETTEVLRRVRSFEASALAVARRLTAGEVDLAIVYTQQCASLPRRFHCLPVDTTPIFYVSAVNESSAHRELALEFVREVEAALPGLRAGSPR